MKRALVSGITGQAGSYLAELLLEKGYAVHGIARRVAVAETDHRFWRINHIRDRLTIHEGDVQDYTRMYQIMSGVEPDEIYHLAAQSDVALSFKDVSGTAKINVDGTIHMLMAMKEAVPKSRFYFAGSSEMFGNTECIVQTERTPFNPQSPYAITKALGYHFCHLYRHAYDMFCCCGILFNHESPRRGEEFVTRKIAKGVADIKKGKYDVLELGNLDARRDWGFAGDYTEAMWMMLQRGTPDDYVIATGKSHSVREFCEYAFKHVGLKYEKYVSSSEAYKRPSDVHVLCGDASKAWRDLGWTPTVTFKELVEMMVDAEMK